MTVLLERQNPTVMIEVTPLQFLHAEPEDHDPQDMLQSCRFDTWLPYMAL